MKKALVLLPILALMLVVPVVAQPNLNLSSSLASKPVSLTVSFNQAQFQWRGVSVFGDWTPGYSYLEYATSSDFNLTGNVLHTSISYSPLVEGLQGESTVYVYNKNASVWLEKEGQIKYMYAAGYGDYQVVNFWRGYLDFGGNAPSTETLAHGVGYQWVYVLAPEDAVLTAPNTVYGQWDAKVGAWLVGFSIYLWDAAPQAYDIPFPDPFVEPVPANNFNPLDL